MDSPDCWRLLASKWRAKNSLGVFIYIFCKVFTTALKSTQSST